MARKYQQTKRAAAQEETRQRIVEAAIKLHQSKGPAATSMRDVAQEAGVGTVTVYRHFADDMELLGACSGTYFERHPLPDLEEWATVEGGEERFRHGLAAAYAFHRETEPMISSVIDDLRGTPIMAPYYSYWQAAGETLLAAFTEPKRKDPLLSATIALALNFETWRLLALHQGLSDEQVINLMTRLLRDGR
ncbi:TetR/AcrR family transcriptional regulator [Aestuariicoccus sp. MJ-SS9]|uniref:TetR/AcrR family transcriptional regulator n=1 Tax=Aestuariicoccus sp. MJ-SS9 TaxID=3079855 RepID=UPI00290E65CF|nr:TetR family transcriptional regulator [Aestuariicoccus sp. MJ-SS9]MDU8913937.1 TetR family transcriptional regulator [Aestuariicoccus sp. MJ-SS9]